MEVKSDLLAPILRQIETFGILPLDDSIFGRSRHVFARAEMVALRVVNFDLDESARGMDIRIDAQLVSDHGNRFNHDRRMSIVGAGGDLFEPGPTIGAKRRAAEEGVSPTEESAVTLGVGAEVFALNSVLCRNR